MSLSEVSRRWRGLGFAAALVMAVVAGGVIFAHSRTVRAHFLTLSADRIPQDADLMRYGVSRGAAAYAEHCAACHGPKMRGDPSRAVPNLVDQDWLYGSGRVSDIEHVILYGIRAGNSKGWDLAHMPAFASAHPYNLYAMTPLDPNELQDVTTYVLSFSQPQTDGAAVERGRQVFHEANKGNCVDCHGFDGKGDSAIGAPDLTDAIWLRGDGSRADVEDSIAHGLIGRCPAWSAVLPPETIRAIAVYIYAAGRNQLE